MIPFANLDLGLSSLKGSTRENRKSPFWALFDKGHAQSKPPKKSETWAKLHPKRWVASPRKPKPRNLDSSLEKHVAWDISQHLICKALEISQFNSDAFAAPMKTRF